MVTKQTQQTDVLSSKGAKSSEKPEKPEKFREIKAQIIQKQQEKAKQQTTQISKIKDQKSEKISLNFIVKRKNVIPRGIKLIGLVVSDKMNQTVVVKTQTKDIYPKYHLQYTRTHKIKAHNPKEINAASGDTVEIQECRKISKYKSFIVTKILNRGVQK
ncbi:MAG: 30S ribosomal protein S17 [Candidatus Huberarchaeum crystalense]|uniref:30S ribosomal protein S17 n=1 Tax=Huberarchaeum crystalense TaxID=2014257 RepID=A0A2H9QTA2_HUBC1|nr:30S ribosomal protein S17 [archaeon]PIV13569.1 MAG: 30S ribosomal protein S17 [Candidatus Huberarchaeum crystalense]NCS98274.1 30S ribosomal protein S17 [archaeon]PIV46434.1 MAG: 30S ribosomal protein S17 [Candidatus Huberarchaeum crystalense]PIV89936.1 MAG: 30S ribosomal protein S17 [Candidatus Huberarchaeum crystalense]